MFIKANSCPMCLTPWKEGNITCLSCGAAAELYFERPLPSRDCVDEAKLEQIVSRVRSYLVDHQNHGLARYTLGLAYVNLGLLSEGWAELKRAAQLLPEKVQIAYEAAVVGAKLGDFSNAMLDSLNRVIERKPDFKEALFLRGILMRERGNLGEAARAWREACKLDSSYVPAERELQEFVRGNVKLLRDPQIAASVRRKSSSQNAIDYLDLISADEPIKPPSLGSTSMSVLRTISPAKAKVMRRMYAKDLHQYEESMQQRNTRLAELEQDLILLSELCAAALNARSTIAAAAPLGVHSGAPRTGAKLTVTERSQILESEIQSYQRQGYALIARTETTAQLSKKHEFSCLLAFILFIFVIGILYILYYLVAKKEHLVFLEVDEWGRIHRTFS
jgi:tetratricopeptide (TPR) repeat protein